MRGKLDCCLFQADAVRLIPAHAGKTCACSSTRRGKRAHPRACGENRESDGSVDVGDGSSPRMRGKHRRSASRRHPLRLIPAHAGKTLRPSDGAYCSRAHPRACGENNGLGADKKREYGSSPRMRGKREKPVRTTKNDRLIPAHAGKTFETGSRHLGSWAHPRACGENIPTRSPARPAGGSSPRMRGKQHLRIRDRVPDGLIPAHAGKTGSFEAGRWWWGAHPRACGENAERSGVLTLRSVRSWKTLSFPSSLKVTHCRTFVQLSLSSIRL